MYVKLFESFLDSTVWMEDDHVVRIWLAMLLLADRDGIVRKPIPGLAHRARVNLSQCRSALDILSQPDPDSQSKVEEGRRILRLDDNEPMWLIVNYEFYRQLQSEQQRREYHAAYMKRYRALKKTQKEESSINTDENVKSVKECEIYGEGPLRHRELDRDLYSKEPKGSSSVSVPPPDVDWIFKQWNECAATYGLTQCRTISPERRKLAQARLGEHGEGSIQAAFNEISQSDLLRGDTKRGWKPTIDWVLKKANMIKVLEGNYREKRGRGGFDPNSAKQKGEVF